MWPPNVSWIADADDTVPIFAAERAVVFMSVDWSIPERHSRKLFCRFALDLDNLDETKNVKLFAVNEDYDECRHHFQSREYAAIAPLGVGTIFWVEKGVVLDVVINPLSMSATGLLDRTRNHWNDLSKQQKR